MLIYFGKLGTAVS